MEERRISLKSYGVGNDLRTPGRTHVISTSKTEFVTEMGKKKEENSCPILEITGLRQTKPASHRRLSSSPTSHWQSSASH